MSVRTLVLATSITLALVYGARAQDQDAVVDTPEDVQSTSEAATAPDISDESSSYLSAEALTPGRTRRAHKTTAAIFSLRR